eukprot:TRINITY_DN1225_c0_g1_i1.p1 TRINITY_DN1225_c0_g1~~TRINITY_DN1225_c0_g1_i1.p1  ORF type:complete len:125 (+),score=26.06 TRINITY_DN1225_c0_g1_i1:53-427(+)
MAWERMWNVLTLEFVGMFYILLIIHLASFNPQYTVFAVFAAFFLTVFIAAKVSGAQLNAAVSFLCYLNNKDEDHLATAKYTYCALAQFAGGIAAGAVVHALGLPLANLYEQEHKMLLASVFLEG